MCASARIFLGCKKRKIIKKCKNIWSYEKKVVTLHDFSRIVGFGMCYDDAKMGMKMGLTN